MALEIPNGFAQIAYRFALSGDPDVMVSTVGVDLAANTGSDQTNVDTLADQFMATFPVTAIFAGWTFLGVSARVGVGGTSHVAVEAPRVHAGTATGATPPQNCSVLVKKFSAAAGRRGRGRMYLPPFNLAESSVSAAGILDATSLANQQLGLDLWLGSDWQFYILHDSLPSSLAPTPITQFTVDRMIATQRRRLRR
jgi:hypothetical protein